MKSSLNQSPDVRYKERVLPSFGAFLPAFLVWPTIWLALAPINSMLGAVLGLLVNVLVFALMYFGSPVIVITDRTLTVGRATIPLGLLGNATHVTVQEKRSQTGPELDARAYLQLQATVKEMVKVQIEDPQDPVPYWLFSTRDPEGVLALLAK